MRQFRLVLRVGAPVFLLVAALHVALGLNADALLGVELPAEVKRNPGLDSQNRFYGAAFALYGVLLLLCAADVAKYAAVLRCVLWMLLAGGVARLVSIGIYGLPPIPVLGLLLIELVAPPLGLWWFARLWRPTAGGQIQD
jgi:hypothetical protein